MSRLPGEILRKKIKLLHIAIKITRKVVTASFEVIGSREKHYVGDKSLVK